MDNKQKTQIEALAAFYADVTNYGVGDLAGKWDAICELGDMSIWMYWQSAHVRVVKDVYYAYVEHLHGRVDAREIVAAATCLDDARRNVWRAEITAESAKRAAARAERKAARAA